MTPIVSFAIATYNRRGTVKNLVCNLLSIARNDIEVVVVDDCSSDGTIEALKSIDDKRLSLFRHKKNANGKMTWYDAYEKSKGDWIFYINDSDWVETKYIAKLIDNLKEFENQNVGFAVAGEKWEMNPSTDYLLYNEGHDTICEFGLRDQHPTGHIFRKEYWRRINNRKKFFFEKRFGIYPHGYIEAIIGNKYKGAYILYDICDRQHIKERLSVVSNSGIYKKDRGNEFFWPTKRYELIELMIENINLVENKEWWYDLVVNGYSRFFRLATVSFLHACKDEVLKRRYGYPDMETTDEEILEYGRDFIHRFHNFLDRKNYSWIDEAFEKNIAELETQLMTKLVEWRDYRILAQQTSLQDKVIIFGAGIQGIEVYHQLGSEKVICFCDNNALKWNTIIEGKRVLSFEESMNVYNKDVLYIITPVNPAISLNIAKQLHSAGVSYRFWV